MNSSSPGTPPFVDAPRGRVWGHVLVSLSACLLTVSILGSGVFLAYKIYQRYQLTTRVRSFISSLENRTPEELAERAAELKDRPRVAQHVLPELRRGLANARSDEQLSAMIEISKAFISHKSIERALFELRRDRREHIAGEAIAALAELEPPEYAAEVLGKSLQGAESGEVSQSVIDEACAGLLRQGAPGLAEMQRRLGELSVDRRVWIVGYVQAVGGPYRKAWLEMLSADAEPRVADAARMALAPAQTQRESAADPVARAGSMEH